MPIDTGGSREIDVIAGNDGRRQTVNFDLGRGLPQLSTQYDPSSFGSQATIRSYTLAVASRFGLSGTNAAVAGVTRSATGGVTLTTAGADDDQMVISPLSINGVYQNDIGDTVWRPDYGLIYRAVLTTGASVASARILAGLKLAFTTTTGAEPHILGSSITDLDYVMFGYDPEEENTPGSWHMIAGNNGADENSPASSFISSAVVRASSRYLLEIAVNGNLEPVFAINGISVGRLSALKSGSVSLKPFVGLCALTGSAKSVTVDSGEVSIGV